MRRCITTFLFASLFVLQIGNHNVRAETGTAIARHRHRGRLQKKQIDGFAKHASRTRSINKINRGGGKEISNDPASASPRASQKILQSMRLLYLTYYASLGALMPYLPVYFHSLGHPGSAIGLLGAVKPLTTFLVAPVWGILSDRSNNHVATLQFTFVSSLICQLLVGANSNLNYLIGTVFLAAVLNAPVKSLIDSIVMSKLTSEEDRHQFGRMRLWGQLGFGVGSSLVGSLLSAFPADSSADPQQQPTVSSSPTDPTLEKVVHNIEEVVHNIEVGIEVASETNAATETSSVSSIKGVTALVEMTRDLLGRTRPLKGYEWAFVTHAILSIPVIFCIRAFRPEKSEPVEGKNKNKKQPTSNEMEEKKTDIGQGLRQLPKDALIFFFLVFVIGTSSGCIENFAYVRVREVGGTGNNMGLLRLVSSLAGAPMFWFSGPITEALGTDVVLVLSLLAYVARFFNYAWMGHPYHALPAEALRGITFAAFWSSGSMYAHKISPPGMKATMLLIMNAMYGGLGQSLGAIIGGKLQSKVGTVNTFVYSGIFDICFVGALVAYLASGKERAFSTSTIQP
mmetsp:Transcript_26177/g.44642  ORF Transcript_26177/g.44642 Transcript_26177/m.44642 type:complete len:569 (+) Transcript_26177:92-1798(+)